jgi:capping protein beta
MGLFLVFFLVANESSKVQGSWDSIHVVEVLEAGRSAHYKLTSTIMLYMITERPALGTMNLAGSLTRQSGLAVP